MNFEEDNDNQENYNFNLGKKPGFKDRDGKKVVVQQRKDDCEESMMNRINSKKKLNTSELDSHQNSFEKFQERSSFKYTGYNLNDSKLKPEELIDEHIYEKL